MSAAAATLPRAGAARLLRPLASLKLTLAGLALLAVGALAAGYGDAPAAVPLAAPLALLAANLLAAIATNPVIRRERALLAFHVALFALVALAAAGRLTYLKGRLELSTGEVFSGTLTQAEQGPLHRSRLETIPFSNEGFEIGYSPGLNRDETRNLVRWSEAGQVKEAIVGDNVPLELAGYRFYTTGNKGFAPLVAWRDAQGVADRGTIHLPSYPLHEHGQAQEWTPPGAREPVWLMLQFDEVLIDPAAPGRFRLPGRHEIVVRAGGQRHVLRPGASVTLAGGTLTYEGLTTWMGYEVYYDWTLPWLLAASLLAVAALGWHFARKFSRERWDA